VRDSSKMKNHIFFVRCNAVEAFLVLREQRASYLSSSRKACDEEARFAVVFLVDAGAPATPDYSSRQTCDEEADFGRIFL
jgi:hypothetical protein